MGDAWDVSHFQVEFGANQVILVRSMAAKAQLPVRARILSVHSDTSHTLLRFILRAPVLGLSAPVPQAL
jgi:hypothetical protein